jgi:hypothetical protein
MDSTAQAGANLDANTFHCNIEGCPTTGKLNVCGGCKVTHYCSSDCQKSDWQAHKAFCKTMQASRNEGNPTKTKISLTSIGPDGSSSVSKLKLPLAPSRAQVGGALRDMSERGSVKGLEHFTSPGSSRIQSFQNESSMTNYIQNHRETSLQNPRKFPFTDERKAKLDKLLSENNLQKLLQKIWRTESSPEFKEWLKSQAYEKGNPFLAFELSSLLLTELKANPAFGRELSDSIIEIAKFKNLGTILTRMDTKCVDDSSTQDCPFVLTMHYNIQCSELCSDRDEAEHIAQAFQGQRSSELEILRDKLADYPSPKWVQQQSMGVYLGRLPEMLSKEDQLLARREFLEESLRNLR